MAEPFSAGVAAEKTGLIGGSRLSAAEGAGETWRWRVGPAGRGGRRAAGPSCSRGGRAAWTGGARAVKRGRALLAAGPCGAIVSWAERIAGQAERDRAVCGVRVRVSAGPRGPCGGTSWASLLGPSRRRRGPTGPRGKDGLGCFGFGSSFHFYFFFFCKLTQTSLNSNKFEFKLPSTQPKQKYAPA